MTWYRTGTVSVTNNSATVTLAGGDALQNIFPDDGFVGPDGRTYPIQSIGGTGTFTLAVTYKGPTAAAQPYVIIPVADYTQLRDVLTQVNALIASYQSVTLNAGVGRFGMGTAASPGVRASGHEGTGLVWNTDDTLSISVAGTIVATFGTGGGLTNVTFPDGSAATPGIRFTNDTNTGIYRPAGDNLALVAGGSEKLRVNSTGVSVGAAGTTNLDVNGNILAGSTANATTGAAILGSRYNDGQVATFGNLRGSGALGIGFCLQPSSSVSNTWVSSVSNAWGRAGIQLDASGLTIGFAPSQTTPIGDAITLTNLFKVNANNGSVSIGTTSNGLAGERLTVFSASDGGPSFVSRYDAGTNKPYFLLRHVDSPNLCRLDANSSSGIAQISLAIKNVDALLITNSLHVVPGADNVQTIGAASKRWSVVYAGTGTINTSDARVKTPKRDLTKEELKAASRIAKTIGVFKFLDGNREHVGIIAQEVWGIMAEEGLIKPLSKEEDPTCKYAFLCWDKWDEEREPVFEDVEVTKTRMVEVRSEEPDPETGEHTFSQKEETYTEVEKQKVGERVSVEAGDRFSIRSDQLALFIQAAQEQRIAALEAALAKAS